VIKWPLRRRQEARTIEPSHMVNPRRAELETAKEILAEIFGVRAVEVEEDGGDGGGAPGGRGALACDLLPGGVAMGRSFESVRMGAKDVSARWLKASKALKKED